MDITPAIRSYVQKKLAKFAKLLGDDTSFHVILDVVKDRHKAEILLKSRLLELAGKGQSDDLYNSIILAIEKLEKQALKQKGKLIEGKRSKAKEKSVATRTGVGDPTSKALRNAKGAQDADDAPRRPASVREEALNKKPMTVEEATLELEHADVPFVAFRNAASGDMNVLYRRKNGSLRLIKG
jgi:putative sigma-54 modulation protein